MPKHMLTEEGETYYHDCGRLVVRRLKTGDYAGLRIPSFMSRKRRSVTSLIEWHDNLERTERLLSAGLGKMIADKPVRRADVFWGFDPYRFDTEDSRKAIRWVLQYFGLTINP